MLSDKPKVLILTAGYGDGHNSAARGIAEALEGKAECKVMDIFALAMPLVFEYTRKGYLWTIAHAPNLWRQMYDFTDSIDMSQDSMAAMYQIRNYLESVLEDFKPDAVVCTYMVYPYMLDRYFEKCGRRIPYITVVTDSLIINKTWLCSRTDVWAVTDRWTKEAMVDRGLDDQRICVTGFAVSPKLQELSKQVQATWMPGQRFNVLYFPQGSTKSILAMLNAILSAHPNIKVTCVLGRHFRKYYKHLVPVLKSVGSRLKIKGWTKKVPQLMSSHHLVVGKAGGATTHECIALARPMLVNFRTPGQEEGNVELLEKLGGGCFVETPAELRETLSFALSNDGQLWKEMQTSLEHLDRGKGAIRIADWCLTGRCGEVAL